MDDKIYRGPGHPVDAHFHSGPPGKQGLPGVSPKVDMAYNEEEGTVVFTVTDGYGQRTEEVPVAEIVTEWADESGPGVIDQWLDDHPEATTTVEDGAITKAKLNNSVVEVIDNKEDKYERPFRIVAVSDVHYNNLVWYDRLGAERMGLLIDALIEEHQRQPIDVLLILGDLSNDNKNAEQMSYVKKLYDEFLYRLPFPVMSLPGNHDVWTNDEWRSFTGLPRQYSFLFREYVFVMLDMYDPASGVTTADAYIPMDYEYVQSMMELYPDKKFILCGHSFYPELDGAEAIEVANDERVLFLASGHTHTKEARAYGAKINIKTGHFSTAIVNGSGISDYDTTNPDCPYGFQSITMTANGIVANYITPKITYYLSDSSTLEHPRTVESDVLLSSYTNYSETTDFSSPCNNAGIPDSDPSSRFYTLSEGKRIRKRTDLDDLTDDGVYYCYNASYAATLINTPITNSGFKLIVEHVNGDQSQFVSTRHIIQTIETGDKNTPMLRRFLNPASTFSPWRRLQYARELSLSLPKSSSIAITCTNDTTSNRWCGIIDVNGGAATNVASWLVQGYGAGGSRIKAFPMNVGDNISLTVSGLELTVANANTSAGAVVYFHLLTGNIEDFTITEVIT